MGEGDFCCCSSDILRFSPSIPGFLDLPSSMSPRLMLLVFVMGSHVLAFGIMLNVTTEHKTCTIIYTLVGMIVSLLCTLPRTMKSVSYLSIVSFGSILAAVLLTMIVVAVMGRGTQVELYSVRETSLAEGFGAVSNIIFAYGEDPS